MDQVDQRWAGGEHGFWEFLWFLGAVTNRPNRRYITHLTDLSFFEGKDFHFLEIWGGLKMPQNDLKKGPENVHQTIPKISRKSLKIVVFSKKYKFM